MEKREDRGRRPGTATLWFAEGLPKLAFAQDWIGDEAIWLEMLEARNRRSHTYHAQDATRIYDRLAAFLLPMQALLDES